MKCPHCGQEHPDELIECPVTGKKLKLACKNPNCSYYGEYIYPFDLDTCPCCGRSLPSDSYKSLGTSSPKMDRIKRNSTNVQNDHKITHIAPQTGKRQEDDEDKKHTEQFTVTINGNSNVAQLLGLLFTDAISKSSQEYLFNDGKPLTPKTLGLKPFRDSSTGKYGYSRLNNIVIPAKYDRAFPFSANDTAKVIVDGSIVIIDKKGNIVSDSLKYSNSNSNSYSLPYGCSSSKLNLCYDRNTQRYGYSFKGETIIPAIYQNAYSFQEGVAAVRKDGKSYQLIESGNYIVEYEDTNPSI